jgi:adenosylhomocysteine nucleosidase
MGAATADHGWLTVRGISDLADQAKNDRHHAIAAQHAAAVFELLAPFLRVPTG